MPAGAQPAALPARSAPGAQRSRRAALPRSSSPAAGRITRARHPALQAAQLRQPRPGLPRAAAAEGRGRRPRHKCCASVFRWRYFQRYRCKYRQRIRPLSTMRPPRAAPTAPDPFLRGAAGSATTAESGDRDEGRGPDGDLRPGRRDDRAAVLVVLLREPTTFGALRPESLERRRRAACARWPAAAGRAPAAHAVARARGTRRPGARGTRRPGARGRRRGGRPRRLPVQRFRGSVPAGRDEESRVITARSAPRKGPRMRAEGQRRRVVKHPIPR